MVFHFIEYQSRGGKYFSYYCSYDAQLQQLSKFAHIRPKKKNSRVSANMPKKFKVGRSENLFIFCLIFVCKKKIKDIYWG